MFSMGNAVPPPFLQGERRPPCQNQSWGNAVPYSREFSERRSTPSKKCWLLNTCSTYVTYVEILQNVILHKFLLSRVEHDISLVRCAHSWDIMFNTRNKSGISAHPCIILYITFIQKVNKMLYVLSYSCWYCCYKEFITNKTCQRKNAHRTFSCSVRVNRLKSIFFKYYSQ
jgi:hypothetical protein